MNKADFEAVCNEIQQSHDRETEVIELAAEMDEISFDEKRRCRHYQDEETLQALRAAVNNYLYGVNSWAVYHPNEGYRIDSEGNPYPTDPKLFRMKTAV